MQDLRPFFTPGHFIETKTPGTYQPLQWGANIQCFTSDRFDWEDADIIIIGCGEQRGENPETAYSDSPDAIREQLYELYSWHSAVKIADAGNIRQGATVDDTRAALRTVL